MFRLKHIKSFLLENKKKPGALCGEGRNDFEAYENGKNN